jgi:hypothetical protein
MMYEFICLLIAATGFAVGWRTIQIKKGDR